jgi:transcriptional regulator NrdR family protein
MKCVKCGADDNSAVCETRRDGEAVYRRRRCGCGHSFWTSETVLEGGPPRSVAHRRIAPLKALDAQRRKEAA